jgi:hypothetical protein
MLITTFENKVFKVFRNKKQVIEQPYRPTPSGDRPEWVDEQEALDWFVNESITLVANEEEKAEYIASLGSSVTDTNP